MLAVTTFSPEGYEKYGFRCVDTLSKHFPGKIVAYVEKDIPPVDRVEQRDYFSIPGAKEYLTRLERQPGANGWSGEVYDYRYDASKFCRKVFVQDAVFDEAELVFWFDADCVIQKDIPEEFLKSLLDGSALAFMGRGKINDKFAYTETGWIGFNTIHLDFQKFRDNYLSYFTTGRIFSQLKGWHDCIAFDYARQGVNGRNLSPNASGISAVIHHTVLSKYITHNKGNRKYK